ncbi:MBL fold metallo-hydrolase [Pseudonocardia sp. CA-107938]|uniref:MBL fold metallo-hydrolase n=1 Tax=Pseudonocardia sp. CA-107938 TaxID=3240021 RepID=UPI003D8E659D
MVPDDDPAGDWTAPGVFRCAPDVYRIPLPLPNDGLRAVNVYAIADGSGFSLVDSGWVLQESRELLVSALAQLGGGLGDVRRFLVTHSHRDHYTLAVALRREFGGRILLGEGEKPGLEELNSPGAGERSPHLPRLLRAGADDLLRRLNAFPRPEFDVSDWELPDEWITDGSVITVGEGDALRELTAIATPGHTRGHVVFADEPGDLLFAGDHVLPRITPSIALEPVPAVSPLADFLASLELVRSRPDATLLPAHGPVGMRVHERVDALLAHHADRLEKSLAAVREGRSTATEVAGALRWTRREHALADLDVFNEMLAVLETMAHLDVLVERGALTVRHEGDVAHYTI